MDMGSLLGSILSTVLNHKRDCYVDCSGSLKKPNIDSSSYEIPAP